jgi:predicted HD phosphohydrolase
MLQPMDALEEVAALLCSLRDVWDEEAVDELDHALQSAARALEDDADDELVLAAALHDVAHSPLFDAPDAARHDAAASAWLTPRFGARVGWLAGAHVAAKRYLVATDPGYGATLSPTSVLSLHAQGGAGTDDDLVAHPWWPDALRLRRYDDAAKDPAATGATIEHVLAIAERVRQQQDPS